MVFRYQIRVLSAAYPTFSRVVLDEKKQGKSIKQKQEEAICCCVFLRFAKHFSGDFPLPKKEKQKGLHEKEFN
jgi:hypothetical protein